MSPVAEKKGVGEETSILAYCFLEERNIEYKRTCAIHFVHRKTILLILISNIKCKLGMRSHIFMTFMKNILTSTKR